MKFKYLKNRLVWIDEMDDFEEVNCPLPYKNLPEGEYMIRGNAKGHRKVYWQVEGRWFLIADVKKDNGHAVVDVCKYELFPNLSDREWRQIGKIGIKKLTKHWKLYYFGYCHWKDIQSTIRSASSARYQILGK